MDVCLSTIEELWIGHTVGANAMEEKKNSRVTPFVSTNSISLFSDIDLMPYMCPNPTITPQFNYSELYVYIIVSKESRTLSLTIERTQKNEVDFYFSRL